MLNNAGKISHAQMEKHVETVYEKFDAIRKAFDAKRADEQDLEDLKKLEDKIKKLK